MVNFERSADIPVRGKVAHTSSVVLTNGWRGWMAQVNTNAFFASNAAADRNVRTPPDHHF